MQTTTKKNIGIVCENHLGMQYITLPSLDSRPSNLDELFNDQRFIIYNKHDAFITLFYYDENNNRKYMTVNISEACEDNKYVKLFIINGETPHLFAYTTQTSNCEYVLL